MFSYITSVNKHWHWHKAIKKTNMKETVYFSGEVNIQKFVYNPQSSRKNIPTEKTISGNTSTVLRMAWVN